MESAAVIRRNGARIREARALATGLVGEVETMILVGRFGVRRGKAEATKYSRGRSKGEGVELWRLKKET